MLELESTLIVGTKPSAKTLERLKEIMNIPDECMVKPLVFEVKYDNKKYYCCWSGGEILNGTPNFTPLGLAAVEVLANLPLRDNSKLFYYNLSLGVNPIREKVVNALKFAGANAKICFLVGIAGELDGQIAHALNLPPHFFSREKGRLY